MLWSICSALQEDVQSATSSQIPQVKPKLWPFWYICSFCSCLFHIGYYSQCIFFCPLYNSPKKDWISKCFGQFVSVKQEDVQSPKVCQIPQAKPKLWPFWYISRCIYMQSKGQCSCNTTELEYNYAYHVWNFPPKWNCIHIGKGGIGGDIRFFQKHLNIFLTNFGDCFKECVGHFFTSFCRKNWQSRVHVCSVYMRHFLHSFTKVISPEVNMSLRMRN